MPGESAREIQDDDAVWDRIERSWLEVFAAMSPDGRNVRPTPELVRTLVMSAADILEAEERERLPESERTPRAVLEELIGIAHELQLGVEMSPGGVGHAC